MEIPLSTREQSESAYFRQSHQLSGLRFCFGMRSLDFFFCKVTEFNEKVRTSGSFYACAVGLIMRLSSGLCKQKRNF